VQHTRLGRTGLQRKVSWSALIGLILNTRALFPLDVPRRCAAKQGTWLDVALVALAYETGLITPGGEP
jgi:hypothetical protein